MSANILEFGMPQKHVLNDRMAIEAGRQVGGGKVRSSRAAAGEKAGGGDRRRFQSGKQEK
jgi:hypothetical protein